MWKQKLFAMTFVFMWEFLNTWNPGGAYVSLSTLVGRDVVEPRPGTVVGQQMVSCAGNGVAGHLIHQGEALTCAECGAYICHEHTYAVASRRLCFDCRNTQDAVSEDIPL